MAVRNIFSRKGKRRSNKQSILNRIATQVGAQDPRHVVIGIILLTALIAFEIFNFDTTRYALNSLLGEITFVRLSWATILAIAFCAIDFAGLARLFTPQKGEDEPKEVWYLMGAWLLGATMNAVMTWWAVSITLLNHQYLGNEILDREQLLRFVPIFVAVLVWLTRILFIGSITVAGEHMFDFHGTADTANGKAKGKTTPRKPNNQTGSNRNTANNTNRRPRPAGAMSFSEGPNAYHQPVNEPSPPYNNQGYGMYASSPEPVRQERSHSAPPTSRVRRRPPSINGVSRGMPNSGMHAKGK